jgi:DNA-binding IclR family transcriptional regulator
MRRPLHSTSLGKALVAFVSQAEQERLLRAIPLQRLTPRTITSPSRLRKELALVRRQGYALDDEEAVAGARCIAAPILDSHQRAVAAVSIAGPVSRIGKAKIPSSCAARGGPKSRRLTGSRQRPSEKESRQKRRYLSG